MDETKDFTPPAPGVWELDATHLHRPASRALAAIYPAAATAGFREGMGRYGMLLETIEFAAVNRYIYICPAPSARRREPRGLRRNRFSSC